MAGEIVIRLGVFAALFIAFAALEAARPRHERAMPRRARWVSNLCMSFLNSCALWLLALGLPLLAVGAAIDAELKGWGFFNQLEWPVWLEGLLAILLLDLAIWAQHLITHKVPLFWRFHRMHHSDRDMDVTTALRFHPAEILASMALKIGLIYGLGPAALAVLVFEILLNGTALFNHANLAIPPKFERLLRALLVTPQMHHIHHSARREEHDSNYGFALSLWDRVFGTYRDAPLDDLTTGLEWQDTRPANLWWSLWLPFR